MYNPQSTVGGISLQGSGPLLQGSSPRLQSSPMALTIQPARGIPLYTGGSTPVTRTVTNTVNTSPGVPPGAPGAPSAPSAPAAPVGPSPEQIASLNASLASILGNTSGNVANAQSELGLYATPSITNFMNQQTQLNTSQEQNQENRILSMQQIGNSLREGLNSGAVKLAAMGGASSSAGEEIARLLGRQASAQGEQVTEQTGSTNTQLGQQQQSLQGQEQVAEGNWQGVRDSQIQYIQDYVNNSIAQLKAQAAAYGAPAPDSSAVNGVVSRGVAALQALDAHLNQGISNLQVMNPDQAYQTIYGALQNGGNYPVTPSPSQFSSTPISVQGNPLTGGAPISNLPLFINSGTKQK